MAAKQPPPLMKKHSQTDLVSRLKTRKILGVGGEDDDGEVHRSKALTFPDQLYDAVFDGAQVTSKTPIRLYGGALLMVTATLAETGLVSLGILLLLASRLLFVAISVYFYYQVGRKPKKV
ncbi:hypothetical protein E2I00_016507 [Balaenoptera physalus]|uniref:Tumor protein p53-inducible protein 11 n=1 Tax=Balaenoptera physalus TaxID=9770 RepID=A0A6A1QEF2_BALPH|nr:hypothetical protein E2I00_016507 [Balaenoptera physalus]